jgi:hypothetical protein
MYRREIEFVYRAGESADVRPSLSRELEIDRRETGFADRTEKSIDKKATLSIGTWNPRVTPWPIALRRLFA